MLRGSQPYPNIMKKRNLFEELMAGLADMANERAGKITLRTIRCQLPPKPVST